MKKLLTIIFLIAAFTSFSQKNEFQIRIGVGYGTFSANTKWNYNFHGNILNTEWNDNFTKLLPHAELKYHFAKARIAIGLHFSVGQRAKPVRNEQTFDLVRIGFGIEYNIVDITDFRFYVGIQPTYRALTIYNGIYIGEDPTYNLSTIWSGIGLSGNIGVFYFIKHSWFGIYAIVGLDGGKIPLAYIFFGDKEQTKENTDATVDCSGFIYNAGLVFRFR